MVSVVTQQTCTLHVQIAKSPVVQCWGPLAAPVQQVMNKLTVPGRKGKHRGSHNKEEFWLL